MILDQMPDGTTYIILNSNDGNRAFDPDNTQLFNPLDSNNIGYYLNNTFYNSLSQKDLIVDRSWDRLFPDGSGTQANVTARIALISYAEYQTYRSLFPANGAYSWWTRTPSGGSSLFVWDVGVNGNLAYTYASYTGCGVRPALYLKPGLLVSDTNEVIGPAPPLPVSPTGLSATATGPTQVELTWQPNTEPDLAGYIIYRNNVEIARVGNSTTTYTDSGLMPNTAYTYGIKAYNTSGLTSDMSNVVVVTTPFELPPAAPSGLQAQPNGPYEVILTWAPNAEEDLAGYRIYRNGALVAEIEGQITSFTDSYLTPDSTYTYELTAVDVYGSESARSEAVTVTTPALPKLVLTATVDNRTINLTWTSVADSYKVLLNGQEVGTTSETKYSISGIEPGSYTVQVIGVRDGETFESNKVNLTVSSITMPPAAQQAKDLLGTTGVVVGSMGSLIALALALKGAPQVLAVVKTALSRRWL